MNVTLTEQSPVTENVTLTEQGPVTENVTLTEQGPVTENVTLTEQGPVTENVTLTEQGPVTENVTISIFEGGLEIDLGEYIVVPDLYDETDATYFYFGWTSIEGGWLVQRQIRATGLSESATTGHANLVDAWANRQSLTYL